MGIFPVEGRFLFYGKYKGNSSDLQVKIVENKIPFSHPFYSFWNEESFTSK